MRNWNVMVLALLVGALAQTVNAEDPRTTPLIDSGDESSTIAGYTDMWSPQLFAWSHSANQFAQIDSFPLQLALLDPDTGIDDGNPETNVPEFIYPRVFEPTDPISYTMMDRAISQRRIAGRLVEIRDQVTASTTEIVNLKASLDAVTAELVASRAETARVATAVESLTTTGITIVPDNSSIIAVLQQLLDEAAKSPTIVPQ